MSATQADINTDNITEGSTNLFTTAARTRTHFSYGTGIQLDTGTLSVTQADINTDNVTEGSTNLFITAARTRGHLSATGDLAYNASTGVFSYTIPTTIASLSNHDTDDLAEGSNLYYTDERVDDRVNNLFTASTGITKVYDDAANTYTLSVTQSDIDTDNVTEGSSNLFTTAARTRTHFTYGTGIKLTTGTIAIDFTEFNTSNITESGNLFYTNSRADARVDLQTGANLDLSSKSTSDLSEGTNLYYTNARADARVVAGITGKLDASEISTFGLTLVDDGSASAARTTLGLGSAAVTASSDYATAAQGTLAASATQPGDLATVATSGAYNDLSGKPTLGSAAATASTDYATAAQGTLATNALPASDVSTFGGTLIDDANASAARTTLGLGSAAVTNSTAYATAAQGALAASALQAETITLATLKSVTAAAADFAAFQTAIAAL